MRLLSAVYDSFIKPFVPIFIIIVIIIALIATYSILTDSIEDGDRKAVKLIVLWGVVFVALVVIPYLFTIAATFALILFIILVVSLCSW